MRLSLCMPTNGVSEWVFPSLDSIYASNVDLKCIEVIVTDNGDNVEFERQMLSYEKNHINLIYKKTNAFMFDNQLEALKLANGDFLKFVNHRAVWLPDRLKYMLDFLTEYELEKPVIYFSNGAMGWGPTANEYDTFDAFVSALGIYGTWTTGVGIWKSKYDEIIERYQYDRISPHAGILYGERKNNKYIINDKYWMKEIEKSHKRKGKYDLYKAFALDEFIITINLYRDGDISEETLIHVKRCFRDFLIRLYRDFNIKKNPCSYDLSGFSKYVNIFFNEEEIIAEAKNDTF